MWLQLKDLSANLKLIKNYLRNTMTQDRLVDLARLIEHRMQACTKNQFWWHCQNVCCEESSQGVFK